MMRTKFGLAFAITTLGLTVAVYASEYNFYEQADKKGCSSIITERGQDECARVQRAKDDACKVPVDCDVDIPADTDLLGPVSAGDVRRPAANRARRGTGWARARYSH